MGAPTCAVCWPRRRRAFYRLPEMELRGGSLLTDGCRRVLDFTPQRICLDMGDTLVTLYGEELRIESFAGKKIDSGRAVCAGRAAQQVGGDAAVKLRLWAADTFRFSVQGPEIHRFLNHAAAAGVRLRRVRWQKGGCSAAADGIDRRRLEKNRGGRRLGHHGDSAPRPGRRAENLLQTRPGLAAGMILFLVLLKFLGGFVWCVDFGAMDADLQPMMRQLLADCAIHEGTRLTKPLLQAAQAKALRRSETFGWISLNFIGGCLSIEAPPAQTRTVREPPAGLYARADGVILAVEIESGFAAVEPGQTVTAGQPLAAAEKPDRKGNAVIQGAQGRIVARVQRQYTASRPLTVRTYAYTGRSTERTTLYLPGYTRTEETGAPLRSAEMQTEWQPLRLGRLALPGCLCRVTSRERAVQTLTYPERTAAALALRDCRAQLLKEFPDAEIEAEQREISAQNQTVQACVTYILRRTSPRGNDSTFFA